MIGGLLGHIQYGWWHGDCLWVDEEYRGQGYASKLMFQAEIYAEDNSLIGIYFETWVFKQDHSMKNWGILFLVNCPIAHLVLHFIL